MVSHLVSETGFVLKKSAVDRATIKRLLDKFTTWERDSAAQTTNYGLAPSGKYRFGVGKGHTQNSPKLIRVNNPCDESEDFENFVFSEQIIAIAKEFLCDSIKFHHCKINTKYPGKDEVIHLHQDFCFDPHTNRSLITLMIPFVDIDSTNGPLVVVPGSQTALESHFSGRRFLGQIPDGWLKYKDSLMEVPMSAGDVLVSDGALIHGSSENLSSQPRPALFIEWSTSDALPLAPYHVPSKFSGRILGKVNAKRNVRLEEMSLEIPESYSQGSIFNLQEGVN